MGSGATTGRAVWSAQGNTQRLDGGAMFGNAPKAVWARWLPPDEGNRVPLACRAMVVREGAPGGAQVADDAGRTVLCEAGIGAFFEPRLRDRYGVVEEEHVLLRSLAGIPGLPAGHRDVDVVVLSHLHFDHAGGLLAPFAEGAAPALLFPKARFVVGEAAWARARSPHARDRASFIGELPALLEATGRLFVVPAGVTDGADVPALGPGYRLHYSDGHTPGLMLTEVALPGGPLVFAGDLIPGRPWVHLPITMGYDRYPELLIDEKRALLQDLGSRGGRLFYTHDPDCAISGVACDDQGRWRAVDPMPEAAGLIH